MWKETGMIGGEVANEGSVNLEGTNSLNCPVLGRVSLLVSKQL